MKNETKDWLKYANDNLESAIILRKSGLYNPCLQNIQQCVEKSLKSVLIERSFQLKKTHSITELRNMLLDESIFVNLNEEECEFLDSIYLPSKYPLGSALPDFIPNDEICESGIILAEKVFTSVNDLLTK